MEYKCLYFKKNYQQNFDEKLKQWLLNTRKFSSHDNNTFFYYCKKVFTLMNKWIIGKNLMKQHYLKMKIFTYF